MTKRPTTTIDFSAQFGGRDAADAVLPYFKALKAAARDLEFTGFPFPELAFILRVDGEVNQFGFSGTGEPDVDCDGEYLSIDIGVSIQDRKRIIQVIEAGIMNSPEIINAAIQCRGTNGFELESLKEPLSLLCQRFIAISNHD